MNKTSNILLTVLIAIMTSLMSWCLLITHRLTVNQAVIIENTRENRIELKRCKNEIASNKERVLKIEINEGLD